MSVRLVSAAAVAWAIAALPGFASADVTLDRVVAVVNTEVILASELDRRTAGAGAENVDRAMVLGEMIDELLLVQVARDRFLTASKEDIDAAIAEIKSINGLSDEQLREHLSQQDYTMAEYRRDVRRQIMVMRLITIDVRVETDALDQDAVKQARDRYVNELRAGAYIDVRLEGSP